MPSSEGPPRREAPQWAPHGTGVPVPEEEPTEATPEDEPERWVVRETSEEAAGMRSTGRHERPGTAEPFLPGKGLSAEPPPSLTKPDVTRPETPRPPVRGLSAQPPSSPAQPPVAPPPGPMADPGRRRALADAFMIEFVGSATWRAMLAVLEGAFPGLGMAAALSGRADEIRGMADGLDRTSSSKLGLPTWLDDAGMVFDLSAHLNARNAPRTPLRARPGRPRASRPYAGAFVIDTLDPLRYHRAVGGPREPRDLPEDAAPATPSDRAEDDSGVVIVANLTSAGVRVLDSLSLWRYAGRVVTGTLHEPSRPRTRSRARRALRALRRVVVIDPDLGVGLCLQTDAGHPPRCLLAFGVDRADDAPPRFVRP
ncbi:hypothetical protein F8568_041585 [Actinomadura sp. LD22]|uniref:Uncharacterized protein n=1 Tax=Actinomadura physcomitrii TaxID=2650748 RepID=A0A6I4MVQ4_9ACTN|nr:hypothetical protein [Actinomadura physcomitrii]MWA06729.1 hypothetical protein [Actinomadura physcomitrii]